MATGSFTAVDQASVSILIRDGERITASVAGTFVAQVAFQKSLGGNGWQTIKVLQASPSAVDFSEAGTYRFFVISYTSGTATYDIAQVVAASVVAGLTGNTFTADQQISAASPRQIFNETDQATNEKLWDLVAEAKSLSIRTRTDADGAGVNILAITRGTGVALSTISFGNATNNPAYTFLGTGLLTVAGDVQVNGGLTCFFTVLAGAFNISQPQPAYYFDENDQGTDLRRWTTDINAGVWKLRTLTDAYGTGTDAITVTRGATTAIASIALGNATNNPTGSWLGSGLFTFGGNLAVTGALASSFNVNVPTTGFTLTIGNNISTQLLNPAGTLATGTITMPATPINGQRVAVSSSQIVTSLTVSPNSGQTVNNAPTTLAAGVGFEYIYVLSSTTWYRLR